MPLKEYFTQQVVTGILAAREDLVFLKTDGNCITALGLRSAQMSRRRRGRPRSLAVGGSSKKPEIEAAVRQKLPHMAESAQIAGLGQDPERENRTDARERLQTLEVWLRVESIRDLSLELRPAIAGASIFLQEQPKHPAHRRWTRREPQQGDPPRRTGAVEIPFGLRKEDGQMMRDQGVAETHFPQGQLVIGVCHFLQIERIPDAGSTNRCVPPVFTRCKIICASFGSFLSHEL